MLVSGRNWRFIGTNGLLWSRKWDYGKSTFLLLLCGKIFPGHQGIVRRLPGLTTHVRIGIAMNTRETPPEEIDFAYMVLEKGLDPESKTERTVLCSWSGDVHENHGNRPNATPEDFASALEDRL